MSRHEFWKKHALDELSDEEWELLCDGCGRCCLQKLQDEETNALYFTDIACRLLDVDSCRCRQYENRFAEVSDCLAVRPLTAEKLSWLPASCAYRRLANNDSLADWHPLISGSADSVAQAGISVRGRCVSETVVPLGEYATHLVDESFVVQKPVMQESTESSDES